MDGVAAEGAAEWVLEPAGRSKAGQRLNLSVAASTSGYLAVRRILPQSGRNEFAPEHGQVRSGRFVSGKLSK